MKRKKQPQTMMDQCRIWRTDGFAHCTVYFRHVKYVNGEANATANDVSAAKNIAISDKI